MSTRQSINLKQSKSASGLHLSSKKIEMVQEKEDIKAKTFDTRRHLDLSINKRTKMRFSIVLAICFLGVASASTLVKRNFFDDLQNKSQDALENLKNFGQDFNQKVQDALKNLLGNHNSTEHTVAKRATNPLQLINDLGDPAKFAQTLLKVLADMATGQGRRKRDLAEDLKKLADAGKEKAQEALKQLMDLLNSFNHGQATTEAAITKRATNPLQLINDLGDPAKFAQDLIKVLADMATGQGRRKRDIAEDLKKLADAGKEKAQEALKQLMDLLNSFNHGTQQATTEAAITKRATNPLQLINDLGDPAKFAQDLLKVLADMATGQGRRKRDLAEDLKKFADAGKQKAQEALKQLQDLFNSFKNGGETSTEKTVSKRDISEDLQKLASAGQEKIQAALKQLQDLFEQFKGGFNHDQSSETVTKRDVSESLKQFGQIAQEKTQAAFQHLKDALASLFGKKPSEQVEDSTEVSVSKRSLEDFQKFNKNLQEQAQQALSGFKNAFADFFNQFRKPFQPQAEDTTESS
ncbi:uncharacterized protein LOC128391354 isoform X1 [Panonychus citri]|uniref:uncharacterized protein LOC128391354 isoform X1 n=1 Tax=Panonychus citri TaxID=50023 RepID=UPI00230778D7|nr:uncharacterized protein LOC128391354 isoform X1 [Panonychus citri]